MSGRGVKYYCSKCGKYRTKEKVWAEDKVVSDVYCKRCGSVVKFVDVANVSEEGIFHRFSKMVAMW